MATSTTTGPTGEASKIDAFIEIVKPYGILEMCRTGVVALERGCHDICRFCGIRNAHDFQTLFTGLVGGLRSFIQTDNHVHTGVLQVQGMSISGMFTRRGFNIYSLTVGETEDPCFSRMTISAEGAVISTHSVLGERSMIFER
mgnify:CR=1 FL=1